MPVIARLFPGITPDYFDTAPVGEAQQFAAIARAEMTRP